MHCLWVGYDYNSFSILNANDQFIHLYQYQKEDIAYLDLQKTISKTLITLSVWCYIDKLLLRVWYDGEQAFFIIISVASICWYILLLHDFSLLDLIFNSLMPFELIQLFCTSTFYRRGSYFLTNECLRGSSKFSRWYFPVFKIMNETCSIEMPLCAYHWYQFFDTPCLVHELIVMVL